MASRCSGPILNYPNHRKTAFFAAYYLSPFLFTLYFFKRILGPSPPHFISCCPVVGCHCRCLELSQTSSPLHQKKKGKPPQKKLHSFIYRSRTATRNPLLPPKNKQTNYPFVYIISLFPKTNNYNQHVSCNNTHPHH